MDKKTIGGFIAALRRANGMTQKELADRLNVSDKTVSRWERDEGAPDLSLIPVIAEVFGVTCDELLRGQRRSPAERTEGEAAPEATEKGERERRRILKSTLADFKNRSLIAVSLAAAGLIAALICNFAFLSFHIVRTAVASSRFASLSSIFMYSESSACENSENCFSTYHSENMKNPMHSATAARV